MFCERIFKGLNKSRVKYLVIGGVAVNLHGYSRTTADLDIILSFKPPNMDRFIKLMRNLKMKPTLPVPIEDLGVPAKRKNLFKVKNCAAFNIYNPKNEFESLDILLDESIDFDKLYNKRERIRAGNITIPIIDIDDLIIMKKKINRERDKIDVNALREIKAIKNDQKKN